MHVKTFSLITVVAAGVTLAGVVSVAPILVALATLVACDSILFALLTYFHEVPV